MYTLDIRKIGAAIGLILAVVVLFNAGIGFRISAYRGMVSSVGVGLIFIATIYINYYSRSLINIRVIQYASLFVLYCAFLAFFGIMEQEYSKVLGWLFLATLIMILVLNKEIGIVLFYFLLFVNLLNLFALLMVLLLHIIPNFSHIPFIVNENSIPFVKEGALGVINYDSTFSFFGYNFKRYTGLVCQSSLVPAYIILPAIMHFVFFKEKYRALPIVICLLSIMTLSGGYIVMLMLMPMFYLLNRLFSLKSLVAFIFIVSFSMFVVAKNAEHVYNFIGTDRSYFDVRLWSGLARLNIIIKMLEDIDLHVWLLGSSINDTGLFGNFFITSVTRSGVVGLFFSIWVVFALSKLLQKYLLVNSNRPGLAYFALIAFFVQGFVYYDFGISNYYGFLIIFVLMFLLQANRYEKSSVALRL